MAAGDILAVRIASAAEHNGWVAEIDIDALSVGGTYDFGLGTNNDPSTAKIVFTLTSLGYDNAGGSTTIQRTVYGTQWVRKASPDQATANEGTAGATLTVRVSLSDFIYDPDTSVTVDIGAGFYAQGGTPNNAATGVSVTNNSTLAYPKVIGRWAWPAFETVQANFLLEAVCFHRSAQNGKPVACVVFEVTDGTTTETVTVTDMTVSTRTGDANTVLVYAATVPISGFTQGAVLTCNFVAYPWVGDSGAVLDSDNGITPPDERLCPHLLLCDKNSTYGGGAAVVDATNGNASTAATWVYANQAAAEAAYGSANTNSYQTISHAIAAITSYNNTNFSRNNPSGGVVLLTGTHTTTTRADQGAMDAWMTITRLSTVARASAIINGGGNVQLGVRRLKVYDVSITGSSTGQLRGSTTLAALWVDNCTLNQTSTSGIYQWLVAYGTRNEVTALTVQFSVFGANRCAWALVRGNNCATPTNALLFAVMGNRNIRLAPVQPANNSASMQESDNAIAAFNTTLGITSIWSTAIELSLASGMALVQNVAESLSSTQAVLTAWGDSSAQPANNVVLWHNTFAGQRSNIGYNDLGSTAYLRSNFSQRNNVFDQWNNKDDTFTTANAARTGSWPVGYNVGSAGNHKRSAASTEWKGEFFGLHNIDGGTLGFVDDASYNNGGGGDASGNGDYHLTPGASGYALVPAGYAVLPFDLEGTARNNAGGGSAGAYEMNPPSSGLPGPLFGSSVIGRSRLFHSLVIR